MTVIFYTTQPESFNAGWSDSNVSKHIAMKRLTKD